MGNKGQVSSPAAKSGLHLQKVFLCVLLDFKGIIHQEILEYIETIYTDIYYQQLERLNIALLQKRLAMVDRHRLLTNMIIPRHTMQGGCSKT